MTKLEALKALAEKVEAQSGSVTFPSDEYDDRANISALHEDISELLKILIAQEEAA